MALAQVTGLDFSSQLLREAEKKTLRNPRWADLDVQWVQGDALELPFPDDSFDAATMGYGLRNGSGMAMEAVVVVLLYASPDC